MDGDHYEGAVCPTGAGGGYGPKLAVDGGIYVEDYSHLEEEAREIAHIDLIDEELLAKDREHGLVHLYISPEENPKEALAFLRERCAGDGH